MRLGYHRRRLAWFGSVMAQSKRLAAQERLAQAGARARPQRERLDAAAARTPASTRRSTASGIPAGAVSLERVPVLEKAELMERFDDMVTDPALHRDELLDVDRDAPPRRAVRGPLPRDDHERLLRPQGPVRL